MKQVKPTRAKPSFEGVAGALMDAAPDGVLFGEKKLRTSPYDPLLLQLKAAGPGKFLRFEDLRARVSLIARSKKLGMRVSFGEQGNTLWVTLSKADLTTDGTVTEEPRRTLADLVLDAIDAKRYTAGEITTWLRSNGVPGVGITQVDGVLSNLARANKIRLKNNSGEPEKWGRK